MRKALAELQKSKADSLDTFTNNNVEETFFVCFF